MRLYIQITVISSTYRILPIIGIKRLEYFLAITIYGKGERMPFVASVWAGGDRYNIKTV
ncbi:MAG TPA: hypothetical protein V6D25_11165 [Leptolyngbyaceae cyanobacterium]